MIVAQAGDISYSNSTSSSFVTESDLPIVFINTHGQTIFDEPKIVVDMGIIYNGPGVRNHLNDIPNAYNGKIGIEYHGSHSQWYPKKSYGFETRDNTGINDNDVSILGLPPEHDWILNAAYPDKSLCRDVLTYQLSREMGHYASRTFFVDLFINGQYQGVYIFMEKIKRDRGRIDIANLHPNEITPPDLTGGYVIKIDKLTGNGGAGWQSDYPPVDHSNGQVIYFQYDYPSTDSIVPAQEAYIQSYVDSFENALAGPDFRDSINGYSKYIGKGSWIDYFFINELSKNLDGYRISTYLYKDKNKTLKTGPVWDYDIAWGNADVCDASDTTGWCYQFQCPGDGFQVPFWWQRLLQDTNYTNEMKCRWINFRQNVLSEQHIHGIIDSIENVLNESQSWNFNQWPILSTYVWPNPVPQPNTYSGHMQNLKNWVSTRLNWLDANIPGNCSCSLNATVQNVSCNSFCDGQAIALGNSPYAKSYLWSNGLDPDTLSGLCQGSYSLTMSDAIGCTKTININVSQPSAVTLNSSVTDATCSGNGCNGSATVNAGGGTAPYVYTWSNGMTGNNVSSLCKGNYTVTVNDDNGCTNSFPVVIQNPFAPSVSAAAVSHVTCYGGSDGSASVNVSGGTPPYSYSWFPSGSTASNANGLSAGLHTVTVHDAAGCSVQLVITISQPSMLAIHPVVNTPDCNGMTGSISVSTTGGTSPFTYLWSPGGSTGSQLNNVQAGNYMVTVTDSRGCTKTSSVNVTQPAPFNFAVTADQPTCFGGNDGSAMVLATGGTGSLSYVWSTGTFGSTANQLAAGNYTVTVTDASNCTGTSTVIISDPPPINLNTSISPATCSVNDGSATVSVLNGTPPYQYSWFPSGSTNPSAINLHAGNQVVTVTDDNGCTAKDTITIVSASGLDITYSGQAAVSCHGSSDAFVNLSVTGGAFPYTYLWTPGGSTSSFVSNLSAGIYTITISDQNGCITEYQLNVTEPDSMIVAVNAVAALCNNTSTGSLTANVTGGTMPYSYLWTPGNKTTRTASGLFTGNYTVRVTDANGCTATATSFVANPAPVSLSVDAFDTQCNQPNGYAIATASGGNGIFSYSWSNGDTGMTGENFRAGNYSVTVTDTNGCSQSAAFSIAGSIGPVASVLTMNPVTCNGGHDGSVTVLSAGGQGSVTYQWSPDVSSGTFAGNLSSGLYSVIVTDSSQCKDSIGFILPQPPPLAALMISENLKCFGTANGKLFADVGGGNPPYQYQWADGQTTDTATGLAAGEHSLVITDSEGCSTSASGMVSQPDSLTIHFNVTHATCQACVDGKIRAEISGGVLPYSYLWLPVNATIDSITDLHSGIYTLCVTDGNSCVKCDSVKVKGGVIGVEEINAATRLYVFPNPLSNSTVFAFTLSSRQTVSIKVFDATGKLAGTILKDEMDAGEHFIRFNAADLSPGIYFYHFVVEDHFRAGTLMIQR